MVPLLQMSEGSSSGPENATLYLRGSTKAAPGSSLSSSAEYLGGNAP